MMMMLKMITIAIPIVCCLFSHVTNAAADWAILHNERIQYRNERYRLNDDSPFSIVIGCVQLSMYRSNNR